MFRSTLLRTFFTYKKFLAGITVLFVVLAALYLIFFHTTAHAQQQGTITGTAWSSTIGWIDLGTTGHGDGLTFSNGALTGNAWSSTIGWITFNGSVNSSGQVSGWATVRSGGQIDLGTTGHGDGLTFSNGALTGNAWGGYPLGWVQFNGSGSCTSNYSCNGNTSSTYTNTQCQQTTTQCSNGCNTQTGQCNTCTVGYTCNSNNTSSTYTNSQCQKTTTQCPSYGSCSTQTGQCTCTAQYTCINSTTSAYINNQCGQSNITSCPSGCNTQTGQCNISQQNGSAQNGCLSIGTNWPTCTKTGRITVGTPATLYWYIVHPVQSCGITGTNGDHWNMTNQRQGSETTSPITTDTNYTISCSEPGGGSFTDSVAITLVPKVIEK